MPSPFPGMDPYIEARHRWADFHHCFLSNCHDQLNKHLPEDHAAVIDVRPAPEFSPGGPRVQFLDEPTEGYVNVITLPDEQVVTRVEVLTPRVKENPGRAEYLAARSRLIDQQVNVVEVDLLTSGDRTLDNSRLPRSDYLVLVRRWDLWEVYPVSVRQPLPTIGVPVGDSVPLDLQAAVDVTYDSGRYGRILRYDHPVQLNLSPADAAWAVDLARRGRS